MLKYIKVLCFMFLLSCVESYEPPAIKNAPSYLVVDGFVNASDGTATVSLSKTIALTEGLPVMVSGASVSLEDQAGLSVDLIENKNGVYYISGLGIDFNERYRIKISADNKDYASDFVEIKQTPPIGDLFWDATQPNALDINVNTSDPTGNNKFYRWRFEETFEYTVPYYSGYIIKDGEAVPRPQEDQIYRCWYNDNSSKILIGTSREFTSNVIQNATLISIPVESIKISLRYSINVQQIALTEEAYTYWLGLYKTTENVGGLFDPMPAQVIGNISGLSDPNETVVGFFSGATISEKRLFITPQDLPGKYWRYRWPICALDSIPIEDIPLKSSTVYLYSPIYSPSSTDVIGYTSAGRSCLDCTTQGGATTKPEFWP